MEKRAIERAEEALRGLGFRVLRVRHFGETARLEFGADELARASEPALAQTIARLVAACGFTEVIVDPRGYRRGSLNDGITLRAV